MVASAVASAVVVREPVMVCMSTLSLTLSTARVTVRGMPQHLMRCVPCAVSGPMAARAALRASMVVRLSGSGLRYMPRPLSSVLSAAVMTPALAEVAALSEQVRVPPVVKIGVTITTSVAVEFCSRSLKSSRREYMS